jgi:hypothetical protein
MEVVWEIRVTLPAHHPLPPPHDNHDNRNNRNIDNNGDDDHDVAGQALETVTRRDMEEDRRQ